MPYVLYRVGPGDTEELLSEHPDFASGWQAGTHVFTVEDEENAYGLCDRGRRVVVKFGFGLFLLWVLIPIVGRIALRLDDQKWAGWHMEILCGSFQNRGVNWIALVVFLLFVAGYNIAATAGVTNRRFDQAVGGGVLVGIGAFAVVAIIRGVASAFLSLF